MAVGLATGRWVAIRKVEAVGNGPVEQISRKFLEMPQQAFNHGKTPSKEAAMGELESKIAAPEELLRWVRDARAMTRLLTGDLTDQELLGTRQETVNPILWAMGHISWFQEKWVLRHLSGRESVNPAVDRWFDSFEVAHETRWELDMPPKEEIFGYMATVLDHVEERIRECGPDQQSTYFNRLSVFHEDMHCEAIAIDRQTWQFNPPAPAIAKGDSGVITGGGPLPEDVEVPGDPAFLLGGTQDMPFVFDNEKWAHPVAVQPFRIGRGAVTNGQFAEFVEAGGYAQPGHWSIGGQHWLGKQQAQHPVYWRRGKGGGWEERRYTQWHPIAEHQPVVHVTWWEAEAYCAWAGRRLPTEAEWELAATTAPGVPASQAKRRYPWGDDLPSPERANMDFHYHGRLDVGALPQGDSAFGCRQMVGNVWEWTADKFFPFPGFVVDPYREYSAPWFGYRKVLRGGCWATRARLLRNTYRNFFTPDRRDVYGGLRTCAR